MGVVFDKGFEPTLFECIDKALATTLGRDVVSTFYFYMTEQSNLTKAQLPEKPPEVIRYLKDMLGEMGFRALQRPLISSIRARFEISEDVHDLPQAIELAKRKYLQESRCDLTILDRNKVWVKMSRA